MLSNDVKNKIFNAVDNLEEDIVKAVSDMVKIKSVTPGFNWNDPENEDGETNVNKYTQKIMEDIGLETDLFSVAEERHNLVGKYESDGKGKSLLFNGHVDVVIPSHGEWEESPFSGLVKDGFIYGRGTVDMKAGNAAALFALKALIDAGYKPQGDVLFHNVVGEELKENEKGTTACLERGYTADAAVVCEPTNEETSPFVISIASAGVFEMKWSVKGKPCHTGMRSEVIRDGGLGEEIGVDAIEKGMIVYQAIKDLEIKWGQTKKHDMFKPGLFCINSAVVNGGTTSSIVADHMEMVISMLYPPQDTPEDIKKEVETQIHNAIQNDDWLRENPPEISWGFNWPAFQVDPNEEIIKLTQEAVKEISPEGGKVSALYAVCDASFIHEKDIPVVVVGPGNPKLAHVIDERLSIKELMEITKIYALLIGKWCGLK